MKTTKYNYKVACEKKLPWVDWFCHVGPMVKVGCLYTRSNKMKYLTFNGKELLFSRGCLEAEYKANLLLK